MRADSRADKIRFHFLKKGFALRKRTILKRFIMDLFRSEGLRIESINYIFCTDPYLRKLNKKHLNHDYNTDILTFVMSSPNKPLIADIFISFDTVKSNSIRFGCTFTSELRRVIFHGALHACGYDDKTTRQKMEMRRREDLLMDKYIQRST